MAQSSFVLGKEWVRPYYLKWFYSRLFPHRYPDQFAECWRYPAQALGSDLRHWMGSAGELPDIVFLPAADWHTRLQRSQHLAAEFGRLGHRCFYLNPHLGREFREPYLTSPGEVVSKLRQKVFELHVHLAREPVYHHRCLTKAESVRILSAMDGLLRGSGSKNFVVIASLPLWSSVAAELRRRYGCRIIYDCHDLWSGFGDFSADLLDAEAELFALSDSVLFSAQWLMDDRCRDRGSIRAKSILLRNAVRAEDFDFLGRRETGRRKTVGYAGSLNFWFDVDAVRLAAERHPEWDFVLFGRVERPELLSLKTLPNVRFMGEVPYATLRYHFSSIDVCMIPFRISPLTLATNPLKLYEYFACGLPVVSSRLPEVELFGDLVYLASSPESFVGQLERAMQENDGSLAVKRRLVAERESWTARCTTLGPLIDSHSMLEVAAAG